MSDAVDWHENIARKFAAAYERSPLMQERLTVWRKLIDRYIKRHHVVLDAGCGPGMLTALAARRAEKVVAVDASKKMLDLARQHCAKHNLNNICFYHDTLQSFLARNDKKFNVILCSSVLEYFENWDDIMGSLLGCLCPNGYLIVSFPNISSPYRILEKSIFLLSGWPKYLSHVKSMPRAKQVLQTAADHGGILKEKIYYAATPVLGSVARRMGMQRLGDNLVSFVFQRVAERN